MLGFFESQERKTRTHAANWLELAEKVWHYRRDHLTAEEEGELNAARSGLSGLLKERAGASQLKAGIESLERVLARTGGAIYPKTSLVENVEFFLVAAIVILGIRAYFIQPFKIPTNSMWPTYYGMTAENFPPGQAAPNSLQRIVRFLAFGARRNTVVAPRSGEISVPLVIRGNRVSVAYTTASGHSWFVIPARVKRYTFYVDGEPASVEVPADFSGVDDVVFDTFFPNREALAAQIERAGQAGTLEDMRVRIDDRSSQYYEATRVPLGKSVRAGDPVVRFDLLTGDQLLVDRISYNFVRPKVGQGFVFRTGNIPDIARSFGDEYYVKRLIGSPGDRIEIREPVLYRNGTPITGAKAFGLNAGKVPPYLGYFNASREDGRFRMLFPGETVTVPEGAYLALGDNSHDSFDGRFWGYVPARDVVGTPLFIYYPFTRRWGPTK